MNYKIFTIEEFNKRVHLFWDLMIKPEFPEWECVPIEHDIAKRMTRTLGYAECIEVNNLMIPNSFKFSYSVLDGRYTLDSIQNIIKHEIGHHLEVLRHGKLSGHGVVFHEIAKEFDFTPYAQANNLKHSEIHTSILMKESKYYLICECGHGHYSTIKAKWVNRIIKKNSVLGI